jgi:hypothetical protein
VEVLNWELGGTDLNRVSGVNSPIIYFYAPDGFSSPGNMALILDPNLTATASNPGQRHWKIIFPGFNRVDAGVTFTIRQAGTGVTTKDLVQYSSGRVTPHSLELWWDPNHPDGAQYRISKVELENTATDSSVTGDAIGLNFVSKIKNAALTIGPTASPGFGSSTIIPAGSIIYIKDLFGICQGAMTPIGTSVSFGLCTVNNAGPLGTALSSNVPLTNFGITSGNSFNILRQAQPLSAYGVNGPVFGSDNTIAFIRNTVPIMFSVSLTGGSITGGSVQIFLPYLAAKPGDPSAVFDPIDTTHDIWVTGLTSGTGTSGTSGTRGTSGSSGGIGAAGTSGTRGTSGTSAVGTSGTSAVGTSGTSGIRGTSGTSGARGTSGTSGAVGVSGTSGTRGSSGTSGRTPIAYTATGVTTLLVPAINSGAIVQVTNVSGTGINPAATAWMEVEMSLYIENWGYVIIDAVNPGVSAAITVRSPSGTWLAPGVAPGQTIPPGSSVLPGGYVGNSGTAGTSGATTILAVKKNNVAAGSYPILNINNPTGGITNTFSSSGSGATAQINISQALTANLQNICSNGFVTDSNLSLTTPANLSTNVGGIILTAPNATRWLITVDNSGSLVTTQQ